MNKFDGMKSSGIRRVRIDAISDPRLDIFRSLKTTNDTRYENLFIAEGTTLVERLFQSDYEVTAVMASAQKLRNFESRIPADVTVFEVERDLATQLVGYTFHLGVVAAAKRKPPPSLPSVLPKTGAGLVLFCDHIIDPQNVGMVIRVGCAFGADAIVLSAGSADAFSRRVLRVSTGNGLFIPIVENVSAEEAVAELQAHDFSCCAAVLEKDATDLSRYSFPSRSVIVFGNETHGISPAVIDRCDQKLTIPMFNGTDSVNVSIATGIFSYAYRSQRPG